MNIDESADALGYNLLATAVSGSQATLTLSSLEAAYVQATQDMRHAQLNELLGTMAQPNRQHEQQYQRLLQEKTVRALADRYLDTEQIQVAVQEREGAVRLCFSVALRKRSAVQAVRQVNLAHMQHAGRDYADLLLTVADACIYELKAQLDSTGYEQRQNSTTGFI